MQDNKADAVKRLSDAFLNGVKKGLDKNATSGSPSPATQTVAVTKIAGNHFLVLESGGTLADAQAVTATELGATILALLGEFSTDLDAEENSNLH